MSVFIVDKITSNMFQDSEGRAMLFTDITNDGYERKYALQEVLQDSYNWYIEDFVLDCSHAFVRRRYKDSFIAAWHGKLASEAPLFKEYLNLFSKFYDEKYKWARQKIALLSPDDLRARRKLQIPDSRPFIKKGAVAIWSPQDVADANTPEGRAALDNYLLGGVEDVEMIDEDLPQKGYSWFEKLPKHGEIVRYRMMGNFIVQRYVWTKDDLIVLLRHSTEDFMIEVPVEELKLTWSGNWVRESYWGWESIQDILRWMSPGVKFGTQIAGSMVGRFVPAAIGAPRGTYFYHATLATITTLPWMAERSYDYMIAQLSDPKKIYLTEDNIPRGMEHYFNAITGRDVSTKKGEGMLQSAKNFVQGAMGTVKGAALSAGRTVEKLFYGAIVLGGVGIAFKLVS